MFCLIGHRGVGKTTILKSLAKEIRVIDLDEQISLEVGLSVAEIFKQKGEEFFRDLEIKTYQSIKKRNDCDLLSLGAGFIFDRLEDEDKKSVDFIWLRRVSDKKGRSFLKRPSLFKDMDPLAEYMSLFSKREKRYSAYADSTFFMGENDFGSITKALRSIILKENYEIKGRLTFGVDKSPFENTLFEYRTDLIRTDEILSLLKKGDLVSIRSKASQEFLDKCLKFEVEVDIPIEQISTFSIPNESLSKVIVSSHDNLDVEEIIEIEKKGFHLKWAPLIKDMSELIRAHSLFKSYDMSFLPRFLDSSKWQWYRFFTYSKNRVQFFRFSTGSDLSQPFWYQVNEEVCLENDLKGCVIGSPIEHSFSPGFHREFFKGCYQAIEISTQELTNETLSFLCNLGISCFSVTSPLKSFISRLVAVEKPVNTLYKLPSGFKAINTDIDSIKGLDEEFKDKKVMIWGAGVVGEQFLNRLPKAKLYSVRDWSDKSIDESYDILLWCAGSRGSVPRLKDAPKEVFDIDYTDSSKAKEYAVKHSLEYKSGLSFFNKQALGQQNWWSSLLKGESSHEEKI